MVLSVGFCGHLERCAPLVLDAIRRSSLAERHHFFDTNIHVAHHWNTNLPRVAWQEAPLFEQLLGTAPATDSTSAGTLSSHEESSDVSSGDRRSQERR